MVWWAPLAAAAGSAAFNKYNTDRNQRRIDKLTDEDRAMWENINLPEFEAPQYEDYSYAGDITAPEVDAALMDYVLRSDPALMDAPQELSTEGYSPASYDPALSTGPSLASLLQAEGREQDPTELKGISSDPRLREAQMNALQSLIDIGEGGGMTAQERADLDRMRGEVDRRNQAQLGAIKQNMAMRGMGGSGLELMLQQQAAQDAASRDNDATLAIDAMGKQRALDALLSAGQMGGDIRGQEFGEQAQVGSAQDIINQFNTGNFNDLARFNVQQQAATDRFNVGNQNMFDLSNIDALNRAAQFNVDNQNQALRYGADNVRFNIGNQMDVNRFNVGAQNQADAANTAIMNQANQMNTAAQNQANQFNARNQLQAQQANRDLRQDVRNRNTGLANQAMDVGSQQDQQNFQNQMQRGGAISRGRAGQIGQIQGKTDRANRQWENLASGGIQAYDAYSRDNNRKKKKETY
jgi:hypothetical protein